MFIENSAIAELPVTGLLILLRTQTNQEGSIA